MGKDRKVKKKLKHQVQLAEKKELSRIKNNILEGV